ncbi:MAG: hypothetical protein ACREVN_04835 [Gammaproteobacteria bacterium]
MTRTAVTLLRRELWEHPALYIAPLVVLALALVGVVGKMRFVGTVVAQHGAEQVSAALHLGTAGFVVPFLMVLLVVIPLYLLDCLYAERKDRSILFWKSMPVSDAVTVLSKLAVAMIAAPLIVYVVATVTQMLGLSVGNLAIVMTSDAIPSPMQEARAFIQAQAVLLYALFAVSLWYAPIYGWLLLVSAWAKRVPFLWATLVPVALIVLEAEILRSRHFAEWIGDRFSGVFSSGFRVPSWISGDQPDGAFFEQTPNVAELMNPAELFTSVGLWSGLALAAAFVAGAIALRRYRDDS